MTRSPAGQFAGDVPAMSAVDLAAVSDADHLNQQNVVVDFVDDPVITHTYSVGGFLTPQCVSRSN